MPDLDVNLTFYGFAAADSLSYVPVCLMRQQKRNLLFRWSVPPLLRFLRFSLPWRLSREELLCLLFLILLFCCINHNRILLICQHFFKNFLFKINFLIVYIYSNYSVFLLLFLIYLLDFFQFLVEKYQKNHRSKNLLL